MDDPTNTITVLGFVFGLSLAALLYVLLRRGVVTTAALPRVLGVGSTLYCFASLWVLGLFRRQAAPVLTWTAFCVIISLTVGAVAYTGGRMIVERSRGKN
jgi:hypothetical protein